MSSSPNSYTLTASQFESLSDQAKKEILNILSPLEQADIFTDAVQSDPSFNIRYHNARNDSERQAAWDRATQCADVIADIRKNLFNHSNEEHNDILERMYNLGITGCPEYRQLLKYSVFRQRVLD